MLIMVRNLNFVYVVVEDFMNFLIAVEESGDTDEDKEARALLNKFLGASVLMTGMESMMPREITTDRNTKQQKVST